MDINEVRQKRYELEKQIILQLLTFTKETGVIVKDIDVNILDIRTFGNLNPASVYSSVEVELQIPK